MKSLNLNKTRWLTLAAGMVLYLCIGLIYAWSIFVTPLESEFGWNRSQTSIIFTISVIAMSFGSVAGSQLVNRFSGKTSIRMAAAMMAAGLISSTFIRNLEGLYFCYGVLCGFAVGIVYNVNMNMVVKWFPDKPGMASGIMLMCYGMGSMVLGTGSSWVIAHFGWRMAFWILAAIFGSVVFFLAKWILPPPAHVLHELAQKAAENTGKKNSVKKIEALELPTLQVLRRPTAWMYLIWDTILTAAGM